jgi:hypothetical protein
VWKRRRGLWLRNRGLCFWMRIEAGILDTAP